MLVAGSRELFVGIATAAASLTGLLFVVVTVDERLKPSSTPSVVQQVKAAAALLSFTNALAVTLFSLVPGTNAGYPACVVGVVGLLFSLAATRSFVRHMRATVGPGDARPPAAPLRLRHFGLTFHLLVAFGAEILAGAELIAHPRSADWLEAVGYILVAGILAGIARSWELVGGRGTSIVTSITALADRQDASPQTVGSPPGTGGSAPGGAEAGQVDPDR